MNKIILHKKCEKWIAKTAKTNYPLAEKIVKFLKDTLTNAQNPATLPNAKKLQGFSNRYRWRLGDYRIIGIIENGEFKIIEIIKIAHRQEAY